MRIRWNRCKPSFWPLRLRPRPLSCKSVTGLLTYIGNGNETLGLKYIAALGKVAAGSVSVPIALHLDHGTESEVLQAIALGFTSVMFDGDGLSFEENISITKRLCGMAHSIGICMEAEVGEVPKPDGKDFDEAAIALTQPEEAAQFASATGIDTLAVALGSVHGLKTKQISLDLASSRSDQELRVYSAGSPWIFRRIG